MAATVVGELGSSALLPDGDSNKDLTTKIPDKLAAMITLFLAVAEGVRRNSCRSAGVKIEVKTVYAVQKVGGPLDIRTARRAANMYRRTAAAVDGHYCPDIDMSLSSPVWTITRRPRPSSSVTVQHRPGPRSNTSTAAGSDR
jgi:hypothetical protein